MKIEWKIDEGKPLVAGVSLNEVDEYDNSNFVIEKLDEKSWSSIKLSSKTNKNWWSYDIFKFDCRMKEKRRKSRWGDKAKSEAAIGGSHDGSKILEYLPIVENARTTG